MPSTFIRDRAIPLAKSWLNTCLTNHASCSKKARHADIFCSDNSHFITDLSGDGLVPSRLLSFSIAAPAEGQEDVAKLVLSTQLNEDTQYVALSHRWGAPGTHMVRTLQDNIETHVQDGLKVVDLPKTFQDAIIVTRGMGYGYLWIDSLCIIQDDAADWKNEARRMAIIYDNAICTIAAMDAENSAQGLLPEEGGTVGGLESRAWVCQERMIAPRTLMFMDGSINWECRVALANEEDVGFTERRDGGVEGCEREDWVPPRHPKAVFAFFRDWRLPPNEEGQVFARGEDSGLRTKEDFEYGIQTLSVPAKQIKFRKPEANEQDSIRSLENDQKEATPNSSSPAISGEKEKEHEALGNLPTLNIPIAQPLTHNETLNASSPKLENSNQISKDTITQETSDRIETTPSYTLSDDNPPTKIWNARPPPGESGIYVNEATNTVEVFYGDDLAAHAAHAVQATSHIHRTSIHNSWNTHPDGSNPDGSDPFGSFMAVVTNLQRPHKAYTPFLRVWWNFLALYTPRALSYDSDTFLAMNGITSIAQRWTHIRNSFGLWHSFTEYELCWYINRSVPATRPKTPKWLVPSWSWASTRGGLVQNAIWQRYPITPSLMIKPVIGSATGTAFDMPLPFKAWQKSKYHDLELKGDLRKATVKRTKSETGEDIFLFDIDSVGRYSDHERHQFYPDCMSEFPLDEDTDVWVFLIWHFDAKYWKMEEYVDVRLVLKHVGADEWVQNYSLDTMPMDVLEDDRTLRRVGLLETVYGIDEMRDWDEIREDSWWKFVRLV